MNGLKGEPDKCRKKNRISWKPTTNSKSSNSKKSKNPLRWKSRSCSPKKKENHQLSEGSEEHEPWRKNPPTTEKMPFKPIEEKQQPTTAAQNVTSIEFSGLTQECVKQMFKIPDSIFKNFKENHYISYPL
jgi:hypothetical protein